MSTVQTTNIKHAASASNNITLDASGNVGVGTTPGAAAGYTFLTVLNNTTGSAVQTRSGSVDMRLQADAVGAGYAGTISFHPVIFWTNASERMRIDSFGRVGIGTSSPGVNLHVNGTGFVGVNVSGDSTSETQLRFLTNTAARISNQANTPLLFDTNATERMRIDASGNVGIGTSSIADRLSVASASQPKISVQDLNGGAKMIMQAQLGVLGVLGSENNVPVAFVINNTERARITTGGDFQFNSGYGSVATAYGCRAWVNFNGTGTVAIRSSGNVSSITDNGTGIYTVNFTNAMPDVNYSVAASSGGAVGYVLTGERIETLTTGSVRIVILGIVGSTQADVDSGSVFVAIFR